MFGDIGHNLCHITWGSEGWKRPILSPRAYEGIFVGYADSQKAYRIYILKKRTIICSVHICFDVNTNMGTSFQAGGRFNSSITRSSLHSKNSHLSDLPAQILYCPLLLLMTSTLILPWNILQMFQNKFHLFENMFLLFLNIFLLLLIHLLAIHINLGRLHLLMHHRPVPLNQQSEVMLHVSKRLDHPTLSPFLVMLT